MSETRPVKMREQMPLVSAWIDELREVFGTTEINAVIRRGLQPDCLPEQRFFAAENGHTLGQRAPEGVGVTGDKLVLESMRVAVVTGKRGKS